MKRVIFFCVSAAFLAGLGACSPAGTASTEIPAATEIPSATPRPVPVAHNVDMGGTLLNAAEFLDEKKGFVIANAGLTMWTEDGGSTWSSTPMVLAGCVTFCDTHGFDAVDEHLLWIGTDYYSVYFSADGGKTWNRTADLGLQLSVTFPYVSFVDARRGWVGNPSEIFSTEDGGTTWNKLTLPEGIGRIAAIDRSAVGDGYVLDDAGSLYFTSDGGRTWSARDLGLGKAVLFSSEVPNAAMRFPDPQHGVIVLALKDDEGKVRLLRTSDGGATWEQSELPVVIGFFHLSNDGSILTRVQSLDLTVVSLGDV